MASPFFMARPDIATSHFLPLAGASHCRFRPWFCWGAGVMFLGKQARRDAAWHCVALPVFKRKIVL
jgi:hypothetical protein